MGSATGISALERKNSATKKFKAGRFEDAKKGYYMALETLEFGSRTSGLSWEERNEMRGALFANIAACFINQAHHALSAVHTKEDEHAELLTALVCADHAIALRPDWERGYERRADILHSLGRERASKAARRKYAQIKQGIDSFTIKEDDGSARSKFTTPTPERKDIKEEEEEEDFLPLRLSDVQQAILTDPLGWDLWRTPWVRKYHINVESHALDGPEAVGFLAFLNQYHRRGGVDSSSSSSSFPVSLVLSFYKALQVRHWADDFHGHQVLALRPVRPVSVVVAPGGEDEEKISQEKEGEKETGTDSAPAFARRRSENDVRLGKLKTVPESYLLSENQETRAKIIRDLLLGRNIDAFSTLLDLNLELWADAKCGRQDTMLRTIHIAARSGSTPIVRKLINKHRCNPYLPSQDFGPPLAFALSEDPVKGNYRLRSQDSGIVSRGERSTAALSCCFSSRKERAQYQSVVAQTAALLLSDNANHRGEEGTTTNSTAKTTAMISTPPPMANNPDRTIAAGGLLDHSPDFEMIFLLLSRQSIDGGGAAGGGGGHLSLLDEFKDMDTMYENRLEGGIPDEVFEQEKTTIFHKCLTFPHAAPLFQYFLKMWWAGGTFSEDGEGEGEVGAGRENTKKKCEGERGSGGGEASSSSSPLPVLIPFPFHGDPTKDHPMTPTDRVFPLLFAPVRAARVENVKLLIETYRLNVNTVDAWGNSCLHVAESMLDCSRTSRGYDYLSDLKEVVRYLLLMGADRSMVNNQGKVAKLDRLL